MVDIRQIIYDCLIVEHCDITRAVYRTQIMLRNQKTSLPSDKIEKLARASLTKAQSAIDEFPRKNNPLRIDEVPLPSGTIGMTFCPGKKGPSQNGYYWDRSLTDDLEVIAQWNPDIVVTLLQPYEFELLEVSDFPQRIKEYNFDWMHIKMHDVSPPDNAFEEIWPEAGRKVADTLTQCGKVLMHCRGGIGRTGTIAAVTLCGMGYSPEQAIKLIRSHRSGTIETREQEEYVLERGPFWQKHFS